MSASEGLVVHERPAAGAPAGLLVLHHGRGTDELDLLPLADVLDPRRRLHVVSPRAPLTVPGSAGYHWYLVPMVGKPDPETFTAAIAQLAALHDELWQRTGIAPERTVLGGFSMGAVMSYALGLGPGRPAPAGIMAFSGFLPSVTGWQADTATRGGLPVYVTHGREDQVIPVELGRAARDTLTEGGLQVEYVEHVGGHRIDPRGLPTAQAWLERALAPTA